MWAIPRPQLYCDIIGQKKKEVCLNLLLNLLNWSLIVNTICIPENTGNIHIKIIFFIPFLDAYCNRFLWIYKITRFSYCFGNWWVVVMPVVRGGGVDVRFWTFSGGGWRLPKSNKCEQGGGAVQVLVILWERNSWMPLKYTGDNKLFCSRLLFYELL